MKLANPKVHKLVQIPSHKPHGQDTVIIPSKLAPVKKVK